MTTVLFNDEKDEDIIKIPLKTHTRLQSQKNPAKEPSLNQQFPVCIPGYKLEILDQPEEQHRACYFTEGSRGAVKNRTGDGHAVVQVRI